jgi:hypothetical protein
MYLLYMEFNVRKNATLPVLKMQVVDDGRGGLDSFTNSIETSSLYFSMADVDTGSYKIYMSPAGFVEKTFDALCSSADFSAEEVVKIRTLSAHALRHTFGVHAVAKDMSLNVVQAIFGHESLDTTSIYVRAGMRELALESEKLFSKSA